MEIKVEPFDTSSRLNKRISSYGWLIRDAGFASAGFTGGMFVAQNYWYESYYPLMWIGLAFTLALFFIEALMIVARNREDS